MLMAVLGQSGPQHPIWPSNAGRQSESTQQLLSLAEIEIETGVDEPPQPQKRASGSRTPIETVTLRMRL
jgi:hypothetical protein